jgi:hypothetical protein
MNNMAGAAVVQHIGDLRRREPGVQRDRDAARRRHREQQLEIAVAVERQDGDVKSQRR